jgi:hypothetical protein
MRRPCRIPMAAHPRVRQCSELQLMHTASKQAAKGSRAMAVAAKMSRIALWMMVTIIV